MLKSCNCQKSNTPTMTVLGSLRVPTLNVHQNYESMTVYMTKFVIICDLHMTI